MRSLAGWLSCSMLCVGLVAEPSRGDATLGSVDDFEGPHSWEGNVESTPCQYCQFPLEDVCGCPPPGPEEHGASTQLGGPAGASDTYLQLTALPSSGIEAWNRASDRTGDYTAAGITAVHLHAQNGGSGTLRVRIGLERGTTRWVSSDAAAIDLAGGGGWESASFPLFEATMTRVAGSDPFSHVFERVEEIRILHAAAEQWSGDGGPPLGVDNVMLPEPWGTAPFAAAIGLLAVLARGRRDGATSRRA